MKKIVAIMLMVALVLTLSVTAFAANSPVGEEVYKIHVINGNGAKVETITIKVGESADLKADADLGDFDGWKVYKMDGETAAVEGTDYTLGEGQKLADASITLSPKASLIVTGNYGGKDTAFEIGKNGEVTSPQTGDSVTVCLAAVMMLALTGMVVLKKRTA